MVTKNGQYLWIEVQCGYYTRSLWEIKMSTVPSYNLQNLDKYNDRSTMSMRFCGIPNSPRNTKEKYVVGNSLGVTRETGNTYLIKQKHATNTLFFGGDISWSKTKNNNIRSLDNCLLPYPCSFTVVQYPGLSGLCWIFYFLLKIPFSTNKIFLNISKRYFIFFHQKKNLWEKNSFWKFQHVYL